MTIFLDASEPWFLIFYLLIKIYMSHLSLWLKNIIFKTFPPTHTMPAIYTSVKKLANKKGLHVNTSVILLLSSNYFPISSIIFENIAYKFYSFWENCLSASLTMKGAIYVLFQYKEKMFSLVTRCNMLNSFLSKQTLAYCHWLWHIAYTRIYQWKHEFSLKVYWLIGNGGFLLLSEIYQRSVMHTF